MTQTFAAFDGTPLAAMMIGSSAGKAYHTGPCFQCIPIPGPIVYLLAGFPGLGRVGARLRPGKL